MKQHFDKPITDVIKNRRSVRTYHDSKLPKEVKEKLQDYAEGIKGPFGVGVHMKLIENEDMVKQKGGKIGTYGVIKGASCFVAGIISKEAGSLEELGYSMEKLLLYGEALGLGSCWLGGTFKRSQFAKTLELRDNQLIPAISPIGYPADKRTMLESIMRRVAGSDNRKLWSELFFEGHFDKALTELEAGSYKTVLEMVRLAPSASNKQPWRLVKQTYGYDFYLEHTKGYSKALGFSIQRIDMGIAMCHFYMTAEELGIKGSWMQKPEKHTGVADREYIISWVE